MKEDEIISQLNELGLIIKDKLMTLRFIDEPRKQVIINNYGLDTEIEQVLFFDFIEINGYSIYAPDKKIESLYKKWCAIYKFKI